MRRNTWIEFKTLCIYVLCMYVLPDMSAAASNIQRNVTYGELEVGTVVTEIVVDICAYSGERKSQPDNVRVHTGMTAVRTRPVTSVVLGIWLSLLSTGSGDSGWEVRLLGDTIDLR